MKPTALRVLMGDARAIVRLGAPLVIGNLAIAGMSLADALMAGQLGPRSLAAVAVGSSYYSVFMVLGMGLMMALSPLVAHAYGAGDDRRVGDYARQGAWIASVLAALLILCLGGVEPLLVAIGTDPVIVPDAVGYVHAMAAGMPALLGFLTLRFVSEGLGRTRPIMAIALLGLSVNVIGNWVFMYGRLGAPALGAVGTGVATALVQWSMFAALLLYMRRQRPYWPYGIFNGSMALQPAIVREILRLGLPIAGSLVAEAGLFGATGLLMGTLGANVAAAHQIALNYAAFMFMTPVALHSATTIHVGHALGRGDGAAGRRGGFVGIGLCALLMGVSAIVLLVAHHSIAMLYTRDPAVLGLAADLLLLAGVFQVSDGLQVGAMGALRGFKDARVPLLLTLVAYWAVGFPLTLYLGLGLGLGPQGVWWGLIAGLLAAALALNLRYVRISRSAVSASL